MIQNDISCHHFEYTVRMIVANLRLKWNLFNFDMLITFCFGVSSNLWQQKSPIAEVLRIYFLRTIFWRKFMRKISAVGLFCCDKFEETPKQKVINMSKLNKFHFSNQSTLNKRPPWKGFVSQFLCFQQKYAKIQGICSSRLGIALQLKGQCLTRKDEGYLWGRKQSGISQIFTSTNL